ncbi:hypothetical protein [Aerococcus vaginalis]
MYKGGAVRNVGVSYHDLVDEGYMTYSLFDDNIKREKQEKLDRAVDTIRDKFGYTAVLPVNALMSGSRAIDRSHLIAGHAGGLDGIQ